MKENSVSRPWLREYENHSEREMERGSQKSPWSCCCWKEEHLGLGPESELEAASEMGLSNVVKLFRGLISDKGEY